MESGVYTLLEKKYNFEFMYSHKLNSSKKNNISNYIKALEKIDLTSYLENRVKLLLNGVRDLVFHIKKKDFENVKKFVIKQNIYSVEQQR